MKIALVLPAASKKTLVYGVVFRLEPLGLLYLSSRLRAEGHETVVVDQSLHGLSDAEMLASVQRFGPDLLGISVTYPNARGTLWLAREVKKRRDIPIVVGGCYPTPHPEIVLHPVIDLAVLGEGEDTLSEIVRRVRAGEKPRGIAGTAWSDEGTVALGPPRPRIEDVDALPHPDRRFSDPARIEVRLSFPVWKRRSRALTMVTSRGCGHRCGFCISPILWGGKWIGRSPESVVAEIQELKRDHGLRHVIFMDEEINFDRERSLRLFRLMRDERLNVTWAAETTVRVTDLEVAEAMIEAGMRGLYLGFESGAPEILEKLNKRFRPDDGLRLTRYLQRRGVFTSGNFMLGLPWESRETLAQTRRFARRLNLDVCMVTYHRPQPGTAFSKLSIREGLFDPAGYDETDYDPYLPPVRTFHLSREEVGKAVSRFMLSVYGSPLYWMRILFRILRQPNRFGSYAQYYVTVLGGVLRAVLHKARARSARASS